MTYAELKDLLNKIPEDRINDTVIICDADDNYRTLDGYWTADGTEGTRPGARPESWGNGRRVSKGTLVLTLEEHLWEEGDEE